MTKQDGYWVSSDALRGHLAMWVTRQHPYKSADGCDAVGAAIEEAASKDELFTGNDRWRARKFESARDLEAWLTQAIGEHAQMTVWNTPRSGSTRGFAFVTHNGGPAPEHDFIDIGALLRNVASSAFTETRVETEADRRHGGPAP